jgi:PAS domain S-box-containing protein
MSPSSPPPAGSPAPLSPAELQEIVEGTSAETGEAFFDELVRHLARALGTFGAWVTEWLPETRRLRAFSFWVGNRYYGDYEYDIRHTPCEPVIDNLQLVHVPDCLLDLFPGDPDIREMAAASYLGVPLLDTDGSILGHLAVLHTEPMPDDPRVTSIFRIFAGRAAAELRRLRRDRDLREREQKLSRLFESAMDGIVELNGSLAVTGANRSATQALGCATAELNGRPLADFLSSESAGKLAYLARDLAGRDEGRQSLWIPDGLDARRDDGTPFSAEATLSRFTAAGHPFFTLILRDVDARLEAESRIRALLDETAELRSELEALHGFEEIVGESDALRRVLGDLERVAEGDTTVLVTGETGTGKELVARAIHRRGPRADGPLVKVNCAAIAASLQESEFFGHEKGAFTGATQRREGRFKMADGGTLFLDEVGELPLDLQAKLLRVLQEGEYEPVGGTRTEKVDVRVIAATNRDLESMVVDGTFRRDLLYRLNVFPVHVPSLRERGDDVLLLAEDFLAKLAERRGGPARMLPSDARARLRRYDWPGNVRELQNVLERAWITSPPDGQLDLSRALPVEAGPSVAAPPAPPAPSAPSAATDPILTAAELRELERANLIRALEASGGKISGAGGAAERIGLPPNTLSSRMKSLGIDRPRP